MTLSAPNRSLADLETRASDVAGVLKTLANEKRLMILCKLLEIGEMSVMPLSDEVDLSQSALSQHLAKMRDESIVECRREGQTIFYRVSDPKIRTILETLKTLYC